MITRHAVTTAALAIGAATSNAQTVHTVQPGPWADPDTWDLRVPLATDAAAISHHVTASALVTPTITIDRLVLATDADAALTNLDFADININGPLDAGLLGFTGHISINDGNLTAHTINLALTGPAFIHARGGTVRATSTNAQAQSALTIGDRGFPATITTRGHIASHNGISIGPDATINLLGQLGPNATPPITSLNQSPIELHPAATINLAHAAIEPTTSTTDSITLAIADNSTINGAPNIVPPLGYTLSPDTADASALRYSIDSTPAPFTYSAPGEGDWLNGSNWQQSSLPIDAGGFVTINNGSSPTLDASHQTGGPDALSINTLTIGTNSNFNDSDFTNLTINAIDSVFIAGPLNVAVGDTQNENAPQPNGTILNVGSIELSNADTVRIAGDLNLASSRQRIRTDAELRFQDINQLEFDADLNIAITRIDDAAPGQPPIEGSTADASGRAWITDANTVLIAGDINLAEANGNIINDEGPALLRQNGFISFNRAHEITIAGDINLGTRTPDGGEGFINRAAAWFDSVGTLRVYGDVTSSSPGPPIALDNNIDDVSSVLLRETDATIYGNITLNHDVRVLRQGRTDLLSRILLEDAALNVNSPLPNNLGNIRPGIETLNGTPSPQSLESTVETYIDAESSRLLFAGPIHFGLVADDAPIQASTATIKLSKASHLQTTRLLQGPAGVIDFTIDGLNPASPSTAPNSDTNDPDTHPNIRVVSGQDARATAERGLPQDAVTLNGTVNITFERFAMPSGVTHFDLITTTGNIVNNALINIDADQLPPGLAFDSVSVVSTPTEHALRVTVSGDVIRPCPGDTNNDKLVGPDDLFTLLANFGRTDAQGFAQGDIDLDGTIGPDDLFLLLANFGVNCDDPR